MSFLSVPISLFPTRPKRKIGEINVDVVINENTTDTLTITQQPVQQGASITDHAYKEPTLFSASIYFRDRISTPLDKIYKELLDLQISRVPFDIVTPKRIYRSMLIATLGMTTDKSTEKTLAINLSCQEVIIVQVTTTQVPRVKQKQPAVTAKTEDVGKKSALFTAKEGIGALFGL